MYTENGTNPKQICYSNPNGAPAAPKKDDVEKHRSLDQIRSKPVAEVSGFFRKSIKSRGYHPSGAERDSRLILCLGAI